jgi:anti-sigma B factor antagonist
VKILDEQNIQLIGEQLFALVDNDKKKKIVLDFSNVDYLSSAALGKIIALNNKVKKFLRIF